MAKPNFELMWKLFPDHAKYPTLRTVHNAIGGTLKANIDVPGFEGSTGNTCAVRMSRALNYSTMPISPKLVKSLGLATMTGADGRNYIYRVQDMRKYLDAALGVNPLIALNDFGHAFGGRKGIMAFDVSGWTNASGHLALWNGKAFKEPKHDDYRNLRDNPATVLKEPQTKRIILWPL